MMAMGKKPMPMMEEDEEEDLSGPAESDPEAEEAAIGMLLAGPAKGAEEPAESDPQVLLDQIESAMAQLRKLVGADVVS